MATFDKLLIIVSLAAILDSTAAAPVNEFPKDALVDLENCQWSSINKLLSYMADKSLNATELATRCPQVCGLILGSGNPDISGPGVMISYSIQIAVTCIFCTFLPVIAFAVAHSRFRERLDGNVKFLRKCASGAKETNSLCIITIIIAVLVRNWQAPPVLEILFMSRLAFLQSYIAISLLASPLYDSLFYDVTLSPDQWVYRSLLFVTTVSAVHSVTVPPDEFNLYRDLAKACHQETFDVGHWGI